MKALYHLFLLSLSHPYINLLFCCAHFGAFPCSLQPTDSVTVWFVLVRSFLRSSSASLSPAFLQPVFKPERGAQNSQCWGFDISRNFLTRMTFEPGSTSMALHCSRQAQAAPGCCGLAQLPWASGETGCALQ